MHKKAQQILLSRTRYKHQEYNLIAKQLITCNPGDGFIKNEIVIPSLEGTLKKEYKYVSATLASNPNKAFASNYKKTLELMDEYDRARLLHGDWFAQPKTGGEFYKGFKESKNVQKVLYDDSKTLHLTFDFNVNPYMTLCIWKVEDLKAWQINEICLKRNKNTTQETCKEFINQDCNNKEAVYMYGDPSGRHEDTRSEKGFNDFRIIEKELSNFHPELRVQKKAPSVVMRGRFINAIFGGKTDISIVIGNNCTYTISDYNFVKEAADGTKAKIKVRDPNTKVSYEKYGHTSDANDYFITFVFKPEFDNFVRGKERVISGYGGKSLKQGW